jgi:glycosyltransferase involved in cell wall biosynthesis
MTIGMQPLPRVSIGMPVYNGERYLCRAVDSVLAQTFTDFELIISDNASTDATGELCRAYAARDARVRYIRHAVNRGAAWNVNHVVTLSRARYFKWAHADDMHAPGHLECCIAALDRAPESVVAACTQSVIIDADDRQTELYQDGMDLRQPRSSDRLRLAIRNAGWCNVVFGVLRTDVLRACRPIGAYPLADYVLLNELALRGQVWEAPERLFFRRAHPQNSVRPGRPLAETAVWLDPRNRGRIVLPCWQVLRDTLRAISAVGLPGSEVLRCRMVLLREWLPRRWPDLKGELRCAARTWLGRSRTLDAMIVGTRRWRRRSGSPTKDRA